MGDPYEHLCKVTLFHELAEEDLRALCEASSEVVLTDGEVLFAQGDAGDAAYVITAGAVEILREAADRETLLAVRKPGEVIGEMALLQDEPRMATARARGDTGVLKVPKPAMSALLDSSPTAVRGLFDILLDRLRATESMMRQHERMAQLGTLTAGVAHELNNPSAAVARAADQLGGALEDHRRALTRAAADLDPTMLERLQGLIASAVAPGRLSALERSDLEQRLGGMLDAAGVADPWSQAAELVEAGIGVDDLEALGGAEVATALEALATGRTVTGLVRSIHEGSRRLSAIVGALKSYSFLDRAPLQEVDVTRGIEDTLLILAQKLSGMVVERDFAADLNLIEANGSELNQVWTNLIDNAADAIAERRSAEGPSASGRIHISAYNLGDGVVVEVTDDGAGIPEDVAGRIFDSFFTTKEPGQGTGLGLDISYRIVVNGHGGDLTADSEPGRTTFRVELPGSQRRPVHGDET